MREDWKAFLLDAGAVIEDGETENFGNSVRERKVVTTGGIVADLSHTGLISVHGEDAQSFLASQLTNDLTQVSPQLTQVNGYCNPKGRLFAIFRTFVRENVYYLRVPRDLIQALIKRLRMFVLNAKVTLEDASDSLISIGFSSPKGEEELSDVIGRIPSEVNAAVESEGLTIIRIPGPNPRFEIIGEPAEAQKIWAALDVNAAPVGAGCWALLDILAGFPIVTSPTSELFVPQMINLDAVGGISFTKGCYPGQEIVARMRYLGTLKRRMYLAHCEAKELAQPADDIFQHTGQDVRKVGTVVGAQASQDSGYDLLAVLEITASDKDIYVGDTDAALALMDLPYAVDTYTKG